MKKMTKGKTKKIVVREGYSGKIVIRGLCNECGAKLSEFEILNLGNLCYKCDKERERRAR
jgi:hypothetical protein